MKGIKLGFVTLICMAMLFGCKKETTLIPNAAEPGVKKELNNFIQNYFETKYQLLVNVKPGQAQDSRIASFFTTTGAAETCLNELNMLNTIRSTADLKFTGYYVETEVDFATWKNKGDEVSFRVNLFYKYTTDGTDEQTGDAINPAGYELYNFTVIKQPQGWQIVSQEQTDDENYNSGIVTFENDQIPVFDKNISSYSYSNTTAAAFAIAHWNLVSNISNYCDYTNWGGDCTNFTSRCLRQGGWKHTNYWFYTSNGASGNNMVTYQRSPSWSGANAFYQFISNTGQYMGANGSNRVTSKFTNVIVPQAWDSPAQWTTFYNTVKVLQKGDIVELGNGLSPATISHNMIVTKTQNSPPYIFVSYRNAAGYLPAGDRPINEMYGRHLYGWYIKPSGY
jgi:hypothetical protein